VLDPKCYDVEGDVSWCPGCGDFPILDALKRAMAELGIAPKDLVIVSGIGQAAKLPHYFRSHFFNGLHGRALPVAAAIRAADPGLTVVAVGGDGDMYGEGGNHFLHCVCRNPDIVNLVHDNRVYGLTKGQASPTSPVGFRTPVQVEGVASEPFNPLAVAVALGASFVARANAGDVEQTKELIKRATLHRGYALIDILQPCVSFNKVNTYRWYREHTYSLDDGHDPRDREAAMRLALASDPLPLGVIYTAPPRPVFEEGAGIRREEGRLRDRHPDPAELRRFFEERYI
jgi:2-oxoglutarate ferredoxin oxidoreductase subunit beta